MLEGSLQLSVVVPCYNEAEGLAELRRRVGIAADGAVGENFEIVLVDDGSNDETWLKHTATSLP